ncbi:MAG: protease modulator HflK, partial [Planctomycetota bacterium]
MESLERWQRKDWKPHELVRMAWLILAALILLIGIVTSWYTVAPEEEAVVLRFGRYATTTPPGLHFKLPFFVDEAIKVPVTEVRKLEFGFRTVRPGRRSTFRSRLDEALMLTGDLNIAEVEWVVQYKIKDAKQWIFHVREQEDTIQDLSESVMRAVVGDHTVTEVLTRERAKIAA